VEVWRFKGFSRVFRYQPVTGRWSNKSAINPFSSPSPHASALPLTARILCEQQANTSAKKLPVISRKYQSKRNLKHNQSTVNKSTNIKLRQSNISS